MLPPAPTRLSTTTCWPSVSLSLADIDRAMTSVEPPAAKLTTMRTGFAGHVCAATVGAKAIAASATVSLNARVIRFMSVPPPRISVLVLGQSAVMPAALMISIHRFFSASITVAICAGVFPMGS